MVARSEYRVIVSKIKELWSRPWLRRVLTALFLAVVAVLLIKQGRTLEWHKIIGSAREYRAGTLVLALLCAGMSYSLYSTFDVVGRWYIGGRFGARSAMSTAFVSYAFNQSLGAVIGGIAFRVRLYSKLGLDVPQISKMIMMSMVTNWLGYSTLAGVVFAFGLISLPPGWTLGENALQLIGAAMLATGASYMIVCALNRRRSISVQNERVRIPTFPIAVTQLVLSLLRWPAEAATIYVLLHGRVEFATVLGALLLNAIAGAILHIPAGLGVLEAIFVALLRHRIDSNEILAAILAFRAVYYLVPLAVAALIYIGLETRRKTPQAAVRPALNR